MRIAILLVGHFITFDITKDSFLDNIIRANPDHKFDIYIHTSKSLESKDSGNGTEVQASVPKLGYNYLDCDHNTHSDDINEDEIRDILQPVKMVVETDDDLQKHIYDVLEPAENAVIFSPNVYSQFRKLHLCYNMCQESGINYDLIVKVRPDIKYTRPIIFNPMEPNTIVMQDHYVNDLMYYGPLDTMALLANIFTELDPSSHMDPHNILNYYIVMNDLDIIKSKLGIEIVRKNLDSISYEVDTSTRCIMQPNIVHCTKL